MPDRWRLCGRELIDRGLCPRKVHARGSAPPSPSGAGRAPPPRITHPTPSRSALRRPVGVGTQLAAAGTDGREMTRRFVALGFLAAAVFAASVWLAFALPDGCPGGFHVRGTICLSDGSHFAPSSGVPIPDAQTGLDDRWTMRVDIALAGAFVAGGLAFAASRSVLPRAA